MTPTVAEAPSGSSQLQQPTGPGPGGSWPLAQLVDPRVTPATVVGPGPSQAATSANQEGSLLVTGSSSHSQPASLAASKVGLEQPVRHWVISDVHGCADSLQELIEQLPSQDRLVLCGDVINRGPRIEAAMELAWQLVESGRGTWLMGNHEQLLVHQLRGDAPQPGEAPQFRHRLAGSDTYRQLGGRACRRWLERLEQLPLAFWGDGWVATHAGFDPISWEPHLSIRMAFWQHYDGRFGDVIVGHTPGPAIRHIRSIVLIDTGACYGGPLTAYCPETRAHSKVRGLAGSSTLTLPQSASRPALLR